MDFITAITSIIDEFIIASLGECFALYTLFEPLYICFVIITLGFIAKLVRNSISGS